MKLVGFREMYHIDTLLTLKTRVKDTVAHTQAGSRGQRLDFLGKHDLEFWKRNSLQ